MKPESGYRLEAALKAKGHDANYDENDQRIYLAFGGIHSATITKVYLAEAILESNSAGHIPKTFHVSKDILDWNNGTPLVIARRIKDEDDLDAFPILADALEDAGCTDNAILEHLRDNPGADSWVIDILFNPLYHKSKGELIESLAQTNYFAAELDGNYTEVAKTLHYLKKHHSLSVNEIWGRASDLAFDMAPSPQQIRNFLQLMRLPRSLWLKLKNRKMSLQNALRALVFMDECNQMKPSKVSNQ